MFTAINTETSVILQSATSRVEILPGCGAILNRWTFKGNKKTVELIEGYESVEDFEKNCEAKGFRSAKLSPYVCRMNHSKYQFEGQQYHIGKFELNGMSIHGLLYNNPFEIVKSSADDKAAAVVLRHQYNGSDAGFPFTYTLEVSYTLRASNELVITSSVINTHSAAIPVADGWHPYFSLGCPVNEMQFSMQANTMLQFDEALIPTGQLLSFQQYQQPSLLGDQFFDNCFLLNKPLEGSACQLINQKDGFELTIYPDDSYPYLQVYTPPHRKSIAIENLSAAPDAFNNHMGLVILAPGEKHAFSTRYKAANI